MLQGPQDNYKELISNSGKVLKVKPSQPVGEVARLLKGRSADLVVLSGPSGEVLGVADPRIVLRMVPSGGADHKNDALWDLMKDASRNLHDSGDRSSGLGITRGMPSKRSVSFGGWGSTTAYRCTKYPHIVFDNPCPKHGCPCEPLL